MLKKKNRGAAILETVIVLPLLLLMMFAVLEFQKLGQIRHAVATLAGLMAQDFSISGSMSSFPANIQKFSKVLNSNHLSYYIHLYENLDDITPHEAYFDTDGNGEYTQGEAYADMNFDNSFSLDSFGKDIIFAGKSRIKENFYATHPEIRAGLVVVLYKFTFASPILQKIFSFVSIKDSADELPIIGTGIITRR